MPPLLGEAAATALRRDTTRIGSQDVRVLQERSEAWAKDRATDEMTAWFPGPSVTPLVALAMAVQSRLRVGDQKMARAVRPLMSRKLLTKDLLTQCIEQASSQRQMDLLAKLEPLEGMSVEVSDECADIAQLRESENRLFAVLGGEDILLRSQSCFRVAARALGTESDQRNKHSHGLLDVARLVGSGAKAPTRMAAVRLLGTQICTPHDPQCGDCPLRSSCVYARENAVSGPGSVESDGN